MHFQRKTKGVFTLQGSKFEQAVKKYKDNIYAIAFNYFKNREDAEEILQEAFLKLYKTEKPFANEEHMRNWLIRVTINQCKKVSMSSWFTKHLPLEDYAEAVYEDSEKEESDLFLAVMSMPKKYRIVIHLYYYEDYSVREIAELLSMNEATVRTRLARGRNILKKKLSEVWDNE